jgi:hypothetical protein
MMPPGMSPSGDGGLDVVLAGLQRDAFPLDKEQLCVVVGDLELADASGQRFSVRRLLDRVGETNFDTPEDVAHALRMAVAMEADRVPPE